ncbi:MAG: hypothetical protein H7Y88_02225 [Phycisphaerales bacterium]|nr:hypothetical protein [Phycisphaerales bacterium]
MAPAAPDEPAAAAENLPIDPVRAADPMPSVESASQAMVEAFAGIRVDRRARIVEFDGIVSIHAHDPLAPHVYLELIACTPDTREHETLVMTQAQAAHIHAALLLIGLEPGNPGWLFFEGDKLKIVDPIGPRVRITLSYTNAAGESVTADPREWIENVATGELLDGGARGPGFWVFAGSVIDDRPEYKGYAAQMSGSLIGLATFASETLAWHRAFSPDADVEEPVWIARAATVPPVGTAVTVRIEPAQR